MYRLSSNSTASSCSVWLTRTFSLTKCSNSKANSALWRSTRTVLLIIFHSTRLHLASTLLRCLTSANRSRRSSVIFSQLQRCTTRKPLPWARMSASCMRVTSISRMPAKAFQRSPSTWVSTASAFLNTSMPSIKSKTNWGSSRGEKSSDLLQKLLEKTLKRSKTKSQRTNGKKLSSLKRLLKS